MPGNINHIKCQWLAGVGEVGAGGCGSHDSVCSRGLQPSVSECTLIYIKRSEPHLLMHQQIWAPLLPLSPQHTSAHFGCWDRAGRSTGRCLWDGDLAQPRDHDAQLGAHIQQTHSFLELMNPYSLHKTPQWLLPWDAHCCRTAQLLYQGFLDSGRSPPKRTTWSRRKTGMHQPFPLPHKIRAHC